MFRFTKRKKEEISQQVLTQKKQINLFPPQTHTHNPRQRVRETERRSVKTDINVKVSEQHTKTQSQIRSNSSRCGGDGDDGCGRTLTDVIFSIRNKARELSPTNRNKDTYKHTENRRKIRVIAAKLVRRLFYSSKLIQYFLFYVIPIIRFKTVFILVRQLSFQPILVLLKLVTSHSSLETSQRSTRLQTLTHFPSVQSKSSAVFSLHQRNLPSATTLLPYCFFLDLF